MKSIKWMVAFGACAFLCFASSASAATKMHAKPLAAASAKKMHTSPKADRKAHSQKRSPQHDAQLDYPQLG